MSGRIMGGRYVVFEDMTWPAVTEAVAELGGRLRNAPETLSREDQLALASIVDAWLALVKRKRRDRNLLCRKIAALSEQPKRGQP